MGFLFNQPWTCGRTTWFSSTATTLWRIFQTEQKPSKMKCCIRITLYEIPNPQYSAFLSSELPTNLRRHFPWTINAWTACHFWTACHWLFTSLSCHHNSWCYQEVDVWNMAICFHSRLYDIMWSMGVYFHSKINTNSVVLSVSFSVFFPT